MKDSMVFYASWLDAIKNLPREMQGEVLTAIIEYGLTGETTASLKPITKAMLALVKTQIDINNKRYENSLKGGRKRKDGEDEENQTLTEVEPKSNQSLTKPKPKPNQTQTEVEPNNVYVNDNDINTTTTTPPAGARACEGGKGLPVYNKLLESSLKSKPWLETLCMNYHMGMERLVALLREFVTDSECRGVDDTGKTLRDFKSHFNNWLLVRLRVENEQKQKGNGGRQGNGAAATYGQRRDEAAELTAEILARNHT